MSLIAVVIGLVVLCLAIYAVQAFLPGPTMVKNAISAVLVLIVILWLLGAIGVVNYGRYYS